MTIESLLIALASATLKGSAVLAIAFAVAIVLRRWIPAKWIHLLLLVGVLRLLLPVAPEASISLFNLAAPTAAAQTVSASEGALQAPARTIAAPGATPPAPRKEPRSPLLLLFAVWLGGVSVSAVRTVRDSIAAARVARAAVPMPDDAPAAALLRSCRALAGVTRHVRLAVSEAVAAPSMHGFIRPTLLLPVTWHSSLHFHQLRFVFLHELAHLRRFDVVVNWVTAAAHALHWFNPLVTIALARMSEERELACDALALEHLEPADRRAYGATVLQLVDQWRLPAHVPGAVAMASTRHLMKRRLQMITTFRNDKGSVLWLAIVSLLAAVSLTDARAGERQMVRVKKAGSDAMIVDPRLEQTVSLELTSAGVEDVLTAIANRTGVNITAREGALDQAARDARLTLRATDIPAHLVLSQTLAALDLTVRFSDGAAEVGKADDQEPAHVRAVRGTEGVEMAEKRVVIRKRIGESGEEEIVRHADVAAEGGAMRKRIEVKAHAEEADGVTRRKVTYSGGEGQPEGTLELEVRRANAS